MAERTPTSISLKQTVVTPAVEKNYETFEATVSTDDTILLGHLTALVYAKLCRKSDGSDVTCTIATNVITVTQAATTDVPVVGFAYGT
jgi:hypothetical protein